MTRLRKPIRNLLFSILSLWVWLLCSNTLTMAQQLDQPPDLPGTPVRPIVPDRPGNQTQPAQPIPTPLSDSHDGTTKPGAWIQLKITSLTGRYWTAVEWEDSNGLWHPVDGWHGYSSQGTVRWFVQPTDYGKGPFRWRIYTDQEEQPLITSSNFYLPAEQFATVTVEIKLQ